MLPKLFISYSHDDEWLKNELVLHFSALKRGGLIELWHDRMIPAGGLLDTEIDAAVATSDVFLLLISPAFIASDYCFNNEFLAALARYDAGDATIVPIIVRECDWDVGRLKRFNGLPRDGRAVSKDAYSRTDPSSRDASWTQVISGLKTVVETVKKNLEPPKLAETYSAKMFLIDFIKHPAVKTLDERDIFIDPDLYVERDKEQIRSLDRFVSICGNERAVIVTGGDRSGKSLIAKRTQADLSASERPAVLIRGARIRNMDIKGLVDSAIREQFSSTGFSRSKFTIIIDDFDECKLADRAKEKLVIDLCKTYFSLVIFSFSSASSVLFTSDDLPNPVVIKINPFTDDKVFRLVARWKAVGLAPDEIVLDADHLATYEQLRIVFAQTEIEKSPYTAVTFLEMLESTMGTDIAVSSFAACYDTLISSRLAQLGVNWRSLDESKNFLSLIAFTAFRENESPFLQQKSFDLAAEEYVEQFLSSEDALRKVAIGPFLYKDDDNYRFFEEYLWYFFCARHAVLVLQKHDAVAFEKFLQTCAENIFQKKYANIFIFIAYFSTDKAVVESLLVTLDGLFSKAGDWKLSDAQRSIMVGLHTHDPLLIPPSADVTENRVVLLQARVIDIVHNAEQVVARYTLPFLSTDIADSSYIENIDVTYIDADSYMRSVNALMRIHSVIGQILSGRTGTYTSALVLDCITRMVKASGRYAMLNQAIATVLLYDKAGTIEDLKANYNDKLSPEERYEKITRIFAFWSVYLSHAGLARYLTQEHSIRALSILRKKYAENSIAKGDENTPFNFTLVWLVARLYDEGSVNRDDIEECLKVYGEESALFYFLRVVMHMYAYYMPLSIEDKQWISTKLKMPIQKIEVQRMKAISPLQRAEAAIAGSLGGAKPVIDVEPGNDHSED